MQIRSPLFPVIVTIMILAFWVGDLGSQPKSWFATIIGKADNPTYQQISQESNLFIGNPRLSNQKTDGQFLPGFVFSEVKWEKTLNRKLQWEPNIAPENPFPKGCHISEDNRLEGICSGARFKWTSRYPNIIPETQGVGRWHVIFGMPSFQLRCVSFRECSVELRGPKSQRIKLLDLRWKQQKKLLAKVLGMFKSKKTIKNSTLGINYYLRYMEGFDSVFWQGTFWISKHPQRLEIPWIFLRVPSTYFPPFSKKKKNRKLQQCFGWDSSQDGRCFCSWRMLEDHPSK